MHLQRSSNTGTLALGVLRDDDARAFWVTLETDPIPAGTYVMRYGPHPIHGECWEICDVPGRTGILFHRGNTTVDSKGCVLIADSFAYNIPGLANSRPGYARFLAYLGKLKETHLVVADPAA